MHTGTEWLGEGMREPRGAEAWAELLRGNWETLARSPFRDFFVASHRGCDDPLVWAEHARHDAGIVLHELAPEALACMDVLELGCGVGRLAQVIAPLVRSYTGIDIAPAMLHEAESRVGGLANARLYLGDGTHVPESARDRRYGLVFAQAVLIHCPRELIESILGDAISLLAPGGELRVQLRADPADPSGIRPLEEAPAHGQAPEVPAGAHRPDEIEGMRAVQALLDGRYYMGYAFRHAEVEAFFRALAPAAEVRVMRFDPHNIYVDLRQPRA
jgi:SAM-dependent methyltransferase